MEIKTTRQIYDDLCIHCQQSLRYDDKKITLGCKETERKWVAVDDLLIMIDKEIETGNCVDGGFSSALLLSKILKELKKN